MRVFQSTTGLLCNSSKWLLLLLYVVLYAICSSSSVFATDIDEQEEVVCSKNGVCNSDEDDDFDLSWWMDPKVTLLDMWDRLDCDDLFEEEHRPAHNESTWMLLRGAYIGSMSDEVEMKAYDENRLYGNGFRPGSVEVRVDDEKGRGVYAKELFKEGELVWEGLFTACFANGMAYRRFLRSIPHDLACDVFQWAYSGKEYGACVDLDEGFVRDLSRVVLLVISVKLWLFHLV